MSQAAVMRYGWIVALLALVVLWLRVEGPQLSRSAVAAHQAVGPDDAPLPPTTLAVIDVAKVLKDYRSFQEDLARIKAEIETFDVHVKRESQSLQELLDRMKLAKPGSDEYRELDEGTKRRSADLQVEVALKKRELTGLEGNVYFDHYEKLQGAVRAIAENRKIDLILRFSSEEMKRENRDSIQQGVNRPIVLHPQSHDITSAVIAALNQP